MLVVDEARCARNALQTTSASEMGSHRTVKVRNVAPLFVHNDGENIVELSASHEVLQ